MEFEKGKSIVSMNYESPVNFFQKELETKFENNVMQIVQTYGIDINKDELVKALKYDRDQYRKGYNDGKYDHYSVGVKPYKLDMYHWYCEECRNPIIQLWIYCPFCGQKIRWDMATDEITR